MSQRPQLNKVIHLPKFRMLGRGRPSSGIRVTHIQTIKPPDIKSTKQQEEEQLRAQLHKEIEQRSRVCSHRHYECTLPVLQGREYCARHILEDTTAPYVQCGYTYGNNEKCQLPAPAPSPHDNRREQGLCFEHARAAHAARQRSAAPPPPVTTTETLLTQLQHYVRPERTRTTSCASSVSVVSDPADQDQPGMPHAVDPFKQIDAIAVNSSVSSSIMECASASDSDADSVALGGGAPGGGAPARAARLAPDAEETDYDRQPLRYAGIFTAEEAVSEAKNALDTLQASYIKQMKRLHVLLKAARAQYVKSLKAEKEQYCSINAQVRSGPLTMRERKQLKKLKAYASYHKKHGVDAVLARKLHHKRARAAGAAAGAGAAGGARCAFAEGGVRCAAGALPAARHCRRHVLLDAHQVLFAACGDARAGAACREPAPRLPPPAPACRYHARAPPYTAFALKKEESDSEESSTSEFSQIEDGSDRLAEDIPETMLN